MLQRIAGQQDAGHLRTLADVVEPVKDYNREELAAAPPTQQTPLNRIVDAARPESEAGRQFASRVENFLAGQCKDSVAAGQIRAALESWNTNNSVLQPAASDSSLLQEATGLSQKLAAVAGAGLAALDYIERKEAAPAGWLQQQHSVLEEALKPGSAQLLLAPAPSVQKLVEASANGCSVR
jgi:hexosaminidase